MRVAASLQLGRCREGEELQEFGWDEKGENLCGSEPKIVHHCRTRGAPNGRRWHTSSPDKKSITAVLQYLFNVYSAVGFQKDKLLNESAQSVN